MLTVVIRIRAEEMSEQLGIPRCVAGPHVPDLVAQGVGYEFVFRPFHDVVRAHIWRLSIGIFGRVELLRGEKAEMLTPEQATERGRVVSCFVRLAIHGAVEEVLIFHDDGEFTVVNTKLGLRPSAELIL